jgi:hypothetical protein
MIVIKRYFIDSDKIHAQIQENKLKEPKKQGKFRKTTKVMEQVEAQKAQQRKVFLYKLSEMRAFFCNSIVPSLK